MTLEAATELLAEALRIRAQYPTADELAGMVGVTRQTLYNRATALNKKLAEQEKAGGPTSLPAFESSTEADNGQSTGPIVPVSPTQQPEEASMNNPTEGRSTWIRTS